MYLEFTPEIAQRITSTPRHRSRTAPQLPPKKPSKKRQALKTQMVQQRSSSDHDASSPDATGAQKRSVMLAPSQSGRQKQAAAVETSSPTQRNVFELPKQFLEMQQKNDAAKAKSGGSGGSSLGFFEPRGDNDVRTTTALGLGRVVDTLLVCASLLACFFARCGTYVAVGMSSVHMYALQAWLVVSACFPHVSRAWHKTSASVASSMRKYSPKALSVARQVSSSVFHALSSIVPSSNNIVLSSKRSLSRVWCSPSPFSSVGAHQLHNEAPHTPHAEQDCQKGEPILQQQQQQPEPEQHRCPSSNLDSDTDTGFGQAPRRGEAATAAAPSTFVPLQTHRRNSAGKWREATPYPHHRGSAKVKSLSDDARTVRFGLHFVA